MNKAERDALVRALEDAFTAGVYFQMCTMENKPTRWGGSLPYALAHAPALAALPVSDAEPIECERCQGTRTVVVRGFDTLAEFGPCPDCAAPPALPDGCSWTSGNEPCPTCPRRITALGMCKLLQDEAAPKVPR